jgi:hypothetical protein
MPKIEEWCSWVKFFILYEILLILARANQNSVQIFHQSQKVRQVSWWPVANISKKKKKIQVDFKLLNLSSKKRQVQLRKYQLLGWFRLPISMTEIGHRSDFKFNNRPLKLAKCLHTKVSFSSIATLVSTTDVYVSSFVYLFMLRSWSWEEVIFSFSSFLITFLHFLEEFRKERR